MPRIEGTASKCVQPVESEFCSKSARDLISFTPLPCRDPSGFEGYNTPMCERC